MLWNKTPWHAHQEVLPSTQLLMYDVLDAYARGDNRLLKAHFGQLKLASNTVLLVTSDQQSHGIGTDGKAWQSFPGNIFATYALPWIAERGEAHAAQVGALAVLKVLKENGLIGQLKWINDILIQGRKVGGVLCALRSGFLVVGVGLNVNLEADQAERVYERVLDPLKLPFTSMKMASGKTYGVAPLLDSLTAQILHHYDVLATHKNAFSETFVPVINESLAFGGEKVHYLDLHQKTPVERVLVRLTPEGYAVLADEKGHETIHVNGKIRPFPGEKPQG